MHHWETEGEGERRPLAQLQISLWEWWGHEMWTLYFHLLESTGHRAANTTLSSPHLLLTPGFP